MSADRDRNEAGFSLIESVIMLVVIAALSGLIVQSIRGLAAAQLFTREQARVVSIAERVVQDVAHDLRFAVRVFSESDESRSMLAKLEIDAKGILGGSRMCIPNSDGVFAIDQAGSPVTGNMLFFGASLPHETLDLSPLQTGDDLLRVDCYQFVVYHLVRRTPDEIDLVRWASAPVASWQDLNAISDLKRRARAGLRLTEAGVLFAWDSGAAAAESILTIDPSTGVAALPTGKTVVRVPRDPELSIPRILEQRRAQVAGNGEGGQHDVPKFALATTTFPHGFEIQIDRSGTGSLVLVRLVVALDRGRTLGTTAEGVRLVALRSS